MIRAASKFFAVAVLLAGITTSHAQMLDQFGAAGSSPTGAAGGSLNGTYPNPGLADINSIATSLAIGGATIGSNALAVTGTAKFNSTVTGPDLSTWGSTGLNFSTPNLGATYASSNLVFTSINGVTSPTPNMAFYSYRGGNTLPYALSMTIQEGYIDTANAIVISNKRTTAAGGFMATQDSSMLAVSSDVNGPSVAIEANSATGVASAITVHDLNDPIAASASSWGSTYYRRHYAVSGNGTMYWVPPGTGNTLGSVYPGTGSLTACSWSGGTATCTTSAAHGLAVGVSVTIAGETPSGYNGTYTTIAGTTGSTVKYTIADPSGSGTVQGTWTSAATYAQTATLTLAPTTTGLQLTGGFRPDTISASDVINTSAAGTTAAAAVSVRSAGYGMYSNGAGELNFTNNGASVLGFFGGSAGQIAIRSTAFFGFNSTDTGVVSTLDSVFNRVSAGLIGVNTSAAAGFAGGMKMTSLTVTGANVLLTGMANAATTSAVCYNTGTGALTYDGTIGTCTVSDERLKNMGERIPNALARLLQINGVYYTWKDQTMGAGRQIGVGAQTVERVFPELVQIDSNGRKSADYQRLVAPIIEALRELRADNDNIRIELRRKAK